MSTSLPFDARRLGLSIAQLSVAAHVSERTAALALSRRGLTEDEATRAAEVLGKTRAELWPENETGETLWAWRINRTPTVDVGPVDLAVGKVVSHTQSVGAGPWTIQATVEIHGRPDTANGYTGTNTRGRMAIRKKWRTAGEKLGPAVPAFDVVHCVSVEPCVADHVRQDVGAPYPSAKAAIDGLVNAGVLPVDDDDHVEKLEFRKCAYGTRNALVLHITGTRNHRPE